eukprot:1883143-Rhodomonas_salina.1
MRGDFAAVLHAMSLGEAVKPKAVPEAPALPIAARVAEAKRRIAARFKNTSKQAQAWAAKLTTQ